MKTETILTSVIYIITIAVIIFVYFYYKADLEVFRLKTFEEITMKEFMIMAFVFIIYNQFLALSFRGGKK